MDGTQQKLCMEAQEGVTTEQIWGGGWGSCPKSFVLQGVPQKHAEKRVLGRRHCALCPFLSV